MKRYVVLFVCLLTVSVAAQQKPAAPKVPAAPASPQLVQPFAPPDPEAGGQPTNVRLDVSVIDQTAQGVAQPKSLMVMLVDRATGQTRAAFQDRSIAIDARPTIADGRIRVMITLQSEHSRFLTNAMERDATLDWRNSFSLLLENGKPMIALETMDAVTKRKMSIEVKATIQK